MNDAFVISEGRLVSYNGTSDIVELPDQVVIVGENSFFNSDVHRIVVGKNVKRIESNAFRCCGTLKEIVLPDGIEFIGEMINKCNQLKWIFSNPGTAGEAYAVNHGISVVPRECLDQEWYISNGKVLKCFLKNEKTIALPAGIVCIGPQVFENFRKLESVNIPNSVCRIGTKAFRKCTSLGRVDIPDNVSHLDGCAFESCTSLKDITLPASLEVIWGNCFNNCISLREIVVPKGCTAIHGLAFANCKALRTIIIPASVSSIQDNAFSGCSSNLVAIVQADSFALEFAKEHHLGYKIGF